MKLAAKIIIFLAMLLMPVGLFLAIQGGFFYQLTSRESTDELVESYVNSVFFSQSSQFTEICEAWEISCLSIDSTISAICAKSREIRQQADSTANDICMEFDATCSTIEKARDIACTSIDGEYACQRLEMEVQMVQNAEQICNDTSGYRAEIENAKKMAYEQSVNGVSLASLHKNLESSLITGIAIIFISIILVYATSRNWFTVVNSVIYTVLSTGIIILLVGLFGYQIVNNLVPSLANQEFPQPAKEIIKGIFDYELNTGIMLTAIGAVSLITLILLQKFYFKERVRIYNIWTSSD